MAEHNEIGQQGENEAIEFLKKKGFRILHTNWHSRHKEIDIIAKYQNLIVFIEVKTRSMRSSLIEAPVEAVNRKKQRFVVEAADDYIQKYNIAEEARFDIISVIFYHAKTVIEHIEDAFTAQIY